MMRPTLTEQARSRPDEQLEDHWMRNTLRWSAVLTGMLLVLAACQPAGNGSPAESVGESAAASTGQDPAAVCEAGAAVIACAGHHFRDSVGHGDKCSLLFTSWLCYTCE